MIALISHFIVLLGVYAEKFECGYGAFGKDPYERQCDFRQKIHGTSDQFGHTFRCAHADAFRNKLSDDQREIGYDDDDEGLGDGYGVSLEGFDQSDYLTEALCEDLTRIETGQNADQCNADLDRRKEGVRGVGQFKSGFCGFASFFYVSFETRFSGRYHCDFGHRQDAIEQDQPDNYDNFH